MAVTSLRCLRQVGEVASKQNHLLLPTAATPRLLGSKTPTSKTPKTPMTPGAPASPRFFADCSEAEAQAPTGSPASRPSPRPSPKSSEKAVSGSPAPSPTSARLLGRFSAAIEPPAASPVRQQQRTAVSLAAAAAAAAQATAAAAAPEKSQPPAAAAPVLMAGGQKASSYPVMLGRPGSVAQETPAASGDVTISYGGAGSAPAEARAAFLARRNRVENRGSNLAAEDAARRGGLLQTRGGVEYPTLLGKEALGGAAPAAAADVASKACGQAAADQTSKDPAALAREAWLARKERIGSRRLRELGA